MSAAYAKITEAPIAACRLKGGWANCQKSLRRRKNGEGLGIGLTVANGIMIWISLSIITLCLGDGAGCIFPKPPFFILAGMDLMSGIGLNPRWGEACLMSYLRAVEVSAGLRAAGVLEQNRAGL